MGNKIIIRSPNWIGDCIMTLPACRALKVYFPHSEIVIATRPYLQGIYENIECINGIIPISDKNGLKSLFKTAAQLRQYSFDTGILLTNSFHSALLFRLAGIRNLTGYNKDLRGFLLEKKPDFPQSEIHYIDFYLNLIHIFAGKEPQNGSSYLTSFSRQPVITPGDLERTKTVFHANGIDETRTLIGISPLAAYGPAKAWPPHLFRQLIRKLINEFPGNAPEIMLFGSPAEKENIETIIDPVRKEFRNSAPSLSHPFTVHNLAGQLTLRESMSVISRLQLFVSNDSGLMHIASSFNIPIVVLFGPTPPNKSKPSHPYSRVLHHPVECAPCKHRQCPLPYPNHHRCMEAIKVEEVFDALITLHEESKDFSLKLK